MLELYAIALGCTLAVELPVVAVAVPGHRRGFLLAVGLLLNLFTHPLACAAYWTGSVPFTLLEILVIVVEAVGFRLVGRLTWIRATGLAIAANTLTAAMSWLF